MHPIKNFKVRQYIASHGLGHLITVYLLICAALAALMAVIFFFQTSQIFAFLIFFFSSCQSWRVMGRVSETGKRSFFEQAR